MRPVTGCHRDCHRLSQAVTGCHRLSQTVTGCHRLSQTVTGCHRGCHRLSQATVNFNLADEPPRAAGQTGRAVRGAGRRGRRAAARGRRRGHTPTRSAGRPPSLLQPTPPLFVSSARRRWSCAPRSGSTAACWNWRDFRSEERWGQQPRTPSTRAPQTRQLPRPPSTAPACTWGVLKKATPWLVPFGRSAGVAAAPWFPS